MESGGDVLQGRELAVGDSVLLSNLFQHIVGEVRIQGADVLACLNNRLAELHRKRQAERRSAAYCDPFCFAHAAGVISAI
jgi:hypothetical protein